MKYKLIMLLMIVSLSFIITNSESKAAGSYHNAISIDPLDFLFYSQLLATYEYQLSASNSITGILGYYRYTFDNNYSIKDLSYSELSIGASYRWYLKGLINDKKKPIEGISVGPYAIATFASFSNSAYAGGAYFSIGGEVAYKWIFDSWVVEPIIRLNIPLNKITGFTQYRSFFTGVNIGYAW